MQQQTTPDRYLPEADVLKLSGLSSNTIRNLEKQGRFPKRRKVAPRAVRWLLSEVQVWMADPEGWSRSA
ncbi:MAG: AlpA family phage regulatory protein [Thiothrix sp.]|nr:AlpA family phage regulatory protein [Thiothrix sp.]HPE62416.1 AlpA family phage regulatory protein [Thiolinea sp.]